MFQSYIERFANKKDIKKLFKSLFPICRSITGRGFDDSLYLLGKHIDLNIFKFKTGKKVFDWTIPKVWNIDNAYIKTPNKKKIANFKINNLHVVNYSTPINKYFNLNEIKKKISTLPKMPNAIPYVTSYYNKDWGFCMKHKDFVKLKPGAYKAYINSSLKPGFLKYSDTKIQGKTNDEILLSSYICHPSMANHELSGPILMSLLYKIMKNSGPHKYTYRFLICPENIGAAAFLHKNKKNIKKKVKAGYIINCVGHGQEINYKKSRLGNSLSDRAALNVIRYSNKKYFIHDFAPWGSDERQFCSPGFNLPIGLIMRKMFDGFREYHTSLDNEKFISFSTIIDSLKLYLETIQTIENNFIPIAKIQYGTPQLSKSKIPLYRNKMNWKVKKMEDETKVMLEILNYSDGKMDLIDIANARKFKLVNHLELIKKLLKSGYLKKK